MKRNLFFAIISTFLIVGCSSDPAVNAAFSKYSSRDGIVSITVPGFAVRAATMFAELDPEEKELLRNVELVKVLAVDNDAKYKQLNFNREFSKLVTADYQPLLSVKDGNDDIDVMAKMRNDEDISDLLVIIGGGDNVIIYLKGDFNLTEIAKKSNLLKKRSWKNMVSM